MVAINAYILAVNEAIRTGYGAKRGDDGKYIYPTISGEDIVKNTIKYERPLGNMTIGRRLSARDNELVGKISKRTTSAYGTEIQRKTRHDMTRDRIANPTRLYTPLERKYDQHIDRTGNNLVDHDTYFATMKKLKHREEAEKSGGKRILGTKYPGKDNKEKSNVYNKEATEAKQTSQTPAQPTGASAASSTPKPADTKPVTPVAQPEATPTSTTTTTAPVKRKFTTGQKVGIGVGVAGAAGAAALGARAAYNHKKYGDALHDFHEFQRKRAERKALKEGKVAANESVYHQIAAYATEDEDV